MPSTSVPTLVSRSTSLKRPSSVASIWQCSGSAAGSSSWMEFVSARPIVTTPPSNSKIRSSLSDWTIVSLGIGDPHFRSREAETEGGFLPGPPGVLEEFLDLGPLGPGGRGELQGPGEILNGPGAVAALQPRPAAGDVGVVEVRLEADRLAGVGDHAV